MAKDPTFAEVVIGHHGAHVHMSTLLFNALIGLGIFDRDLVVSILRQGAERKEDTPAERVTAQTLLIVAQALEDAGSPGAQPPPTLTLIKGGRNDD